ncbi:MFS multidrug transporter-like protein [Macrophomina phaseolina]|uniref:MFS multidrug transporter-like protein n=1 Tax=Macrophomina phaseolina TaxID=35725 RepID=A0ABQ8GHK6_9PEZI|nr:MFS multidrug transporter-like protein [Macrophomina phaseolina]
MADEDPRRLSLSRTKSRPSRPPSPQLHRLYSAQHIDDHSLYDREHAAGESETEDNQHGPPRTASHRTVNGSETEKKDDDGSIEIPEVRDGIPDVRDVEKGDPSREKAKADSPPNDPNVVSWDGPEDPANPKNWSLRRKWAACLVVSSFAFISPVSSSMVAPALTSISKDLGVTKEIEEALMLSIFVLAYAIGPLILGPLSEVYGRVLVLQLANAFYLAWNLGCGFAKTPGQMMAFRFLSGLGGSAPLAIGGGTLSDMFKPEQRGKAISVYSLAPLIGPAAGPIAGGFIAENTTWRWVFWATSICDALIQFVGFFYLQETYAPVLLKWKAARLRKETGNQELRSEFDTDKTISKVLGIALIRPFRLLFTQPIIQFLALYMAFLYGLMYLVLSTFPTLWTTTYHESTGIGGLNYISLAVGFSLGVQVAARLNDRIYVRLKARNAGQGLPEFRVPLMLPGTLLVPIGLFWYGWSAQAAIHWIMPNIGAAIFAAGVIVAFQCIQTYLVDSYTLFAASAISAATVLRSLAGFGFPLFAPYMYQALGDGWGNSLLGFVALGLGLPAPVLLWKFGKTLRAKSQFAAGG